jgi:hypothetical protein
VLMKWLGPGSRVQVYAQGPRSGPFRKLHTRIVPFRAGSTYLIKSGVGHTRITGDGLIGTTLISLDDPGALELIPE